MLTSVACRDTTSAPVPAKLAFIVQPPATISSQQIFSPAISVAIQDADGNTVNAATNTVTLSIVNGTQGANLSGTVSVAAVNGVATFTNLSIDRASTYSLSASSPNLTGATSVGFVVRAGPRARLAFATQPTTAFANAILPTLTIEVQDAAGNIVRDGTSQVSLRIGSNPGNAILSGGTVVVTSSGVAAFSSVSINKIGNGYTLIAAAPAFPPAESAPFNLTTGPVSKLVFSTQPTTNAPGATITPAVAVAVQDDFGNTVLTATHSITLSIGTNGGGGVLSGTTTVTAVNGVATFSDLRINNPGAPYTLVAAASGLNANVSAPFSVRNPLAFNSVSAGYFHTCGIATDGLGYCWGENGSGQLAVNNVVSIETPVPVSGGLTFANVVAGRDHTCGVTIAGVAYCWGSNQSGRLGAEVSVAGSPALVLGSHSFAAVAAGYAHSCGTTTTSVAYCWGDNSRGALGNGTQTANLLPSTVTGAISFASVSSGRYFSCGLSTAGLGYCWGEDVDGELGDGTNTFRSSPVLVSGQLTFAMISAGGFHACGLTTAGAAYCWGSNTFGQLGNETNANSNRPVPVSGGLTFAMISAGNRHSCGVTTAGRAYCWGDNSNGNLGDGRGEVSFAPSAVSGGLTFSSVSAGRFHSCGVTTAGAVYCWGTNDNGQLGDGTRVTHLSPVPVR